MRSLMHPQCFLNALGKINPISQPAHPYAARNPPVTLPYRDMGELREKYAPDTGGVAVIGMNIIWTWHSFTFRSAACWLSPSGAQAVDKVYKGHIGTR